MDKYNEDVALLVAQTGPLNGQRWALRNTLLVGREPTCDIVVADRQVSRHHARFTPTYQGVKLEDLGSKNGTHRNGHLMEDAALLQDGDVIQIALAQQFVFLSSDATVPLDGEEIELGSLQMTRSQSENSPGRLRLEKRSRRVWITLGENDFDRREVEVLPPLSVSQFRLLELLYEYQGKVVSRRDLIASVWGDQQAVDVSEQALDALVRRLRDRLASIDHSHSYLVTIRGHGLRLDNPPYP
jgi:hypothetical protein